MKYHFRYPKYFVGEVVWFKDNKGFEMKGTISSIETHWSKKNESYHIYTLHNAFRKRLMHVGEGNIFFSYTKL